MNPQANLEMMKLVVSWALIGAFVFTVALALLSLAGLPGFSESEQRNRLFYALGAEAVIMGIAFFAGAFQPAPGAVVKSIEQPLKLVAATLEQDKKSLLAGQDRLNNELDETKRQLAESVKKASAYVQQIEKANANVDAQRETIAHLQQAAKPVALPPAIVNSDETDALKLRAQKAESELAESRQIEETLTRKLKDYESKISALSESKREKDRQTDRAKVTGRVLATNPGWNFVVLSIGDKQGVIPDSKLLVLRGGAQIAKLRVKTIEASQSIADVIPSTVRKGVTVQPGDNVVFEESQNQPAFLSPPSRTQRGAPIEPDLPPLPSLSR